MKQDTSKQGESFIPPVSAFAGPIAELVSHRLLSPPARPGLLASLGRYEVIRVLGGGGMGVVVLARDSEKALDVAIKLIRPELVSDQRMVHRFVKEAGHLQKLKHANIVPVLEISDRAEGPFFVMPFFEKGSLATRIRPGQPLEGTVVLDIARQVADGLGFAHRHGIIHRDLKPANILLGANGTSCLADFGLARTMFNDTIVDAERDQLEGTAPYMSPGVAAGNAEDTRCDIYAFGAMLYEMLTGEPPYAGRNTSDICKQILAGPPKPIQTRNPAADAGLTAVAEGAMARELRDRYADMTDVLADLDRIKAGKSVVGPRGVAGGAKRNPFLWIPTGIILISAGLWLLWPPAPEKKPATIPAPTNAVPKVVATLPATPAPVPQPAAPTNSAPMPATNHITVPNPWRTPVFAGQPTVAGSADGPVADARFRAPGGIAVDTVGNIYVADTGNNTIRKITRDGTVSTLAGLAGQSGSLDGTGGAARFLAPRGIAVDKKGDVYVTEFANDTVRKITAGGVVTTLAGSPGSPGSQDGVGDNAHFRNPWSVAVDGQENVFVADRSNFTIRKITPDGLVVTLAGSAFARGATDGRGPGARFQDPRGVAVDLLGNVYVTDSGNGVLRKITPSGIVSTLSGVPGTPGYVSAFGFSALFSEVRNVTADESGNIYILTKECIAKMPPKGATLVFPGSQMLDGDFNGIRPTSMAVDEKGDLYLVDGVKNAVWRQPAPSMFKQRQP